MPPSKLPSCTSATCESPDFCPITGLAQGIVTEVERKEVSGDMKQQTLKPPQPTSPLPALKCSEGPRRLRVSAKQNLTANEIPMVPSKLVSDDAISYFLHNSQLMSESRTPSCSPEPTIYNEGVETTVVAALDRVLGILKGNRACRLLSRFAYRQLVWLIDAYKAAAASDRLQRKGRRRVGQRDASVAIDAYLRTKRPLPGETLRRTQISGYCRTGRRWKELAGRSPSLIFNFSATCGHNCVRFHPACVLTDSYGSRWENNSITEHTLTALVARVEHNRPELIEALEKVGKGTDLSLAVQTMPRLEDTAGDMHHVVTQSKGKSRTPARPGRKGE